jgi:hypothetical protein
MPGRKAARVVAEPSETEQLKKPRRRGSGTRRSKASDLYQLEMEFHDPPSTKEERNAPLSASPPPAVHPPHSPPLLEPPHPLSSTAYQAVPLTALASASPASPTPGDSPPGSPSRDQNGTPPESQPTLRNPQSAIQNSHNPPKPGAESSPPGGVITVGGIDFHHASEAEFARLLNYYGIEWEYEPHQFALQWRDGKPIEMFTPDFYLTEFDVYIELTTMRQSLVRRKNRKLRLLRALYPEINIKLLYRRDYQRILTRFGIPQDLVEAEMPVVDDGR